MQATIGCLSRLVSRSLVTGVVSTKDANHSFDQTRLVTAVSGFPKQKSGGYNIDNILRGQIGDDAYFVARHIDDWNCNSCSGDEASTGSSSALFSSDNEAATARVSSSSSSSATSSPTSSAFEDCTSADVIGVADGVGGWRQYGVDPGQFSAQLMANCERLVKTGCFSPSQPARLLAAGYREMLENKKQVIGSSTACVMMLSHRDQRLYTANIGDSGFLVVRRGQVVHRSREQQHSFNTPFQLSLPPSEMEAHVLADEPEVADSYDFRVEDGDVILLATDGIFDNVPDSLLLDQISSNMVEEESNISRKLPPLAKSLSSSRLVDETTSTNVSPSGARLATATATAAAAAVTDDDEFARACEDLAVRLQLCANSIALIARNLSQDPNFLSPFAKNARANGMPHMKGGKEDDITVLLAAVKIKDDFAAD